jgi:hypothetical protein
LTGQRVFLTARVVKPGRALVITNPEFRRLMSSKPSIADTISAADPASRKSSPNWAYWLCNERHLPTFWITPHD